MKLKGISTVEQHFEKGVVGVVGLGLVGVLAMQFLTQPNMVTVGKEQPVPPGDAYKPIERTAQGLLAKLDPAAGQSLLPEPPKANLLAQYQQQVNSGVAPRPQIAMLGRGLNLGDAAPRTGGTSDAPIALAPLPAPANPAVYAYAGTINPAEKLRIQELASLLPAAQPYDKQWVSVEASFDGTALKTALETDPDGDGRARAVPRGWFDRIEIVGMQLERQRLAGDSLADTISGRLDSSAEAWSEPALVPPTPGSPNLIGEMAANVKSMTDVEGVLSKVRNDPDSVLRPEFFSMIAGPSWVPPTEAQARDAKLGGKNEVDVLRDKADELERKLKAKEKQLADLTGGSSDRRGPEIREGGGGGGKSGRQQSSGQGTRRVNERRLKQLETEVSTLAKDLDSTRRRIDDLVSGNTRAQTTQVGELKPLLSNSGVKLWAHDLTAEPGSVYRYRTRVVLNNPLFGRTGLGDEAAAKNPLVFGEWSDWTDPVMVLPTQVFFVSSASLRGPATGTVTAGAECFVFHYGYYRRGSTTLQPGDSIRTVAKLPPQLVIYDEDKLKERGVPGQEMISRPATPRERDPEAYNPAPEQVPQAVPPTGTGDAQGVPFDDMGGLVKPALKEIPIHIKDTLLDVSDIPQLGVAANQQARTDTLAYFRTPGGLIAVRQPSVERSSQLYKQVVASEQQGQNQGQPKPEEKPRDIIRDEGPRTPHGHDDGGGGGGG
ncbi:MAG: hypothetical protein L6Q35_11605 [Phycisphaerales bacterium]|nr:hypothetical protein [Phycisphaerales bacterium]